jgi:hypothetical protein
VPTGKALLLVVSIVVGTTVGTELKKVALIGVGNSLEDIVVRGCIESATLEGLEDIIYD